MARLDTKTGSYVAPKTPRTKDDAEEVHREYLRPAIVRKIKARPGR